MWGPQVAKSSLAPQGWGETLRQIPGKPSFSSHSTAWVVMSKYLGPLQGSLLPHVSVWHQDVSVRPIIDTGWKNTLQTVK